MCATIEPHLDLLFGDIHGGGHVDEVAEDDSGLCIGVAAHLAGEQSLEAPRDDQESHVEERADQKYGEPALIRHGRWNPSTGYSSRACGRGKSSIPWDRRGVRTTAQPEGTISQSVRRGNPG